MSKVDRIRKLLAKANSLGSMADVSYQNEAECARLLAEKMMEVMGLTEADIGPDVEEDPGDSPMTVMGQDGGRVMEMGWYSTAAQAVAKVVGCYTYRDNRTVDGKRVQVRVWIGTANQRDLAMELFTWVVSQIERLADGVKKIAKGQSSPRAFMNAYRLGIASAIYTSAAALAETRATTYTEPGLVKVNVVQAAIDRAKPPGLRNLPSAKYSHSAAFTSGKAAGSSVQLQRTIPSSGVKRLA